MTVSRRRGFGLVVAGMLALSACTSQAAPPDPSSSSFTGSSSSPSQPTPTETGAAEIIEPVLLFVQAQDRTGYATGNTLLGTEPAGLRGDIAGVQMAFIPPSLLVPVRDSLMTLGATATDPDTLTPWESMRAALDLDIEGSWTLDRLAFAGLIDAVGGVFVDVPQAIEVRDEDDQSRMVIRAGRQRLDGITAADYATFAVPGEDERDGAVRFRDVWIAVLARLPESPERLRQILTSLGSLARTTTDVDTLLIALSAGRASVLDRSTTEAYVEVQVIRGGDRPASVLSEAGSRTVETMFADFPLVKPSPEASVVS